MSLTVGLPEHSRFNQSHELHLIIFHCRRMQMGWWTTTYVISSQLQKQAHLILLDIFYTQIARQKQKIAKVTILSVPTKPNQTEKNKCNYNLVSICDKVSDHHLHHEWQLLAAITPHWLHQLLTVGVDNYTTICSEFQANKYRKVWILNFHHISGSSYIK
jgi:hypothetical protein